MRELREVVHLSVYGKKASKHFHLVVCMLYKLGFVCLYVADSPRSIKECFTIMVLLILLLVALQLYANLYHDSCDCSTWH